MGCRGLQKGPRVRRSGMKGKISSENVSFMGKHVFTFTTISNDAQQMDQKTNVMATNGARASFFSSFLTTTTVTQVTGTSERIPVF